MSNPVNSLPTGTPFFVPNCQISMNIHEPNIHESIGSAIIHLRCLVDANPGSVKYVGVATWVSLMRQMPNHSWLSGRRRCALSNLSQNLGPQIGSISSDSGTQMFDIILCFCIQGPHVMQRINVIRRVRNRTGGQLKRIETQEERLSCSGSPRQQKSMGIRPKISTTRPWKESGAWEYHKHRTEFQATAASEMCSIHAGIQK